MSILLSLLFASSLHAQSIESHKSLLMTGDSWAAIMCLDGSFTFSFLKHEMFDVGVRGCSDGTTKLGGRAESWFETIEGQRTLQMLKDNSDIKAVFLSIGGNDFLGNWNRFMTEENEEELFSEILAYTQRIVDALHAIKPNVKVLVSGYDFGNFKDYTKVSGYVKTYKKMGQPTPYELNTALIRFSWFMANIANGSDTFYIHHIGISHYYFGNKDVGLKAHKTLSPDKISTPENPRAYGGRPEYVVYKYAMLNIGKLYTDAYHLSWSGYLHVADHAVDMYLARWFGL